LTNRAAKMREMPIDDIMTHHINSSLGRVSTQASAGLFFLSD